jgi:hypothetical protein
MTEYSGVRGAAALAGIPGKLFVEQMQFDSTLGASELGPWEELQTQRNVGTVQGEQLILEPESVSPRSGLLTGLQGLICVIHRHRFNSLSFRSFRYSGWRNPSIADHAGQRVLPTE